MSSTMSETGSPVLIAGYQVFCNEDNQGPSSSESVPSELRIEDVRSLPSQTAVNGEEDRTDRSTTMHPSTAVQIKQEPVDSGFYLAEAGGLSVSEQIAKITKQVEQAKTSRSSSPLLSDPEQHGVITNTSQSSSNVKSRVRVLMENKGFVPGPSLQNVIEDLLKKNEYLLSQNDAGGFKPNPRKARTPAEHPRVRDPLGDGGTNTFLTSLNSQARITNVTNKPTGVFPAASGNSSPNVTPLSGHILKPRCPTKKCYIPEKDKNHFNLALMESKVTDETSEKIFRVQKHEMVCAVACSTLLIQTGGTLLAQFDLNYYWCNFCSFSTTNKELLLQHVVDHRFHCRYCRYQSFSRSDVIHHTAQKHPKFSGTASVLKYCTLLPDYLQIYSQESECKDHFKRQRDHDDLDDAPAMKSPRNILGNFQKDLGAAEQVRLLQQDFEVFDMEVEELSETSEQGTATVDEEHSFVQQRISLPTAVSASSSTVPISPVPVSSPAPATSIKTHSVANTTTLKSLLNNVNPIDSLVPLPTASLTTQEKNASCSDFKSTLPAHTYSQSVATSKSIPPAPSKSSMSASLYWNCGYCKFTSHSQSEIKDHSLVKHPGKPHRYVALIMQPDQKGGRKEAENSRSLLASQNSDIEADEDDNLDDSSTISQDFMEKREKTKMTKEGASLPTDDPEVDAGILVQKKGGKIGQTRHLSIAFKCYHCNYLVRRKGMLKNHIMYKHKGKCLVGIGLQQEEEGGDFRICFCPRDDCTFGARNSSSYLAHVNKCAPWHRKDAKDVKVESYLLKSLQETIQFSKLLNSQVRTGEFSCIYCNFRSCFPSRTMQHTVSSHPDRRQIIRDVRARRLRKRCFIFFCRSCLWETRIKDEWMDHMALVHGIEEDVFTTGSVASQSTVEEDYLESNGTTKNPIDSYIIRRKPWDPVPSPFKSGSSKPRTRFSSSGWTQPLYSCYHCRKTYSTVVSVRKHINRSHENARLLVVNLKRRRQKLRSVFTLCPYSTCAFMHHKDEELLQHLERTHEVSVEIMEKVKSEMVPYSTSKVVKTSKGDSRRYICLYCTTCHYAPTIRAMKEHCYAYHPGHEIVMRDVQARRQNLNSRVYACSLLDCDFRTLEIKELQLHTYAHDNTHIFECSQCQWFTISPHEIMDHVSVLHEDMNTVIPIFKVVLSLDDVGKVIRHSSELPPS